MTVLILEDDPTMLETLKERLGWAALGFGQVLCAASLPEGKRLLGEQGADLLLLDVEVIRGTGIQLLRWAREHGYDAQCIFLTNHADFEYAQEAVRLGSIDYVLKTEPLSAVEAAVARAVGQLKPDTLFAAGAQDRAGSYGAPDGLKERVAAWESMLLAGHKAALLGDIRAYLGERDQAGARMVLQHDFVQMVYRLLKRQDIQASAMFQGEEDTLSYRNAPNSAFDMLKWLNRFIGRAEALLVEAQRRESVAAKARTYIEEHCGEDLSRQRLAEKFFVNPDHLSHLFNKEMGISLPDFITRTRVEQAKLLLRGGASVSEAAVQVGFDNFAYFSTVFKKLTGVSPSAFRRGEDH